jgi:hypothetical protein
VWLVCNLMLCVVECKKIWYPWDSVTTCYLMLKSFNFLKEFQNSLCFLFYSFNTTGFRIINLSHLDKSPESLLGKYIGPTLGEECKNGGVFTFLLCHKPTLVESFFSFNKHLLNTGRGRNTV